MGKWNQTAYSDFTIPEKCFSLDTDNLSIILDSFMTQGKRRFHSYWDRGKIPTSRLFHIGLWWRTTVNCLPALPGYIRDATGGYTGRGTCMASRGRSLSVYTDLGEEKGKVK